MAKIRVNNRASVRCLEEAKAYLSQDNYLTMRKEYGFIDLLYRLKHFPIQTQTLHWLITRGEVEHNNSLSKRSLKFKIGQHSYSFGHVEFALITGLSFDQYPNVDEEAETPFRTFLDADTLLLEDLLVKLNMAAIQDPGSVETRKLVVLFIIHSMVFVKEQRNTISVWAICLVDDPTLFNVYPWGRLVYDELVKEWANFFRRTVGQGGVIHMKVGTFPFVLQAWVMECLMPEFAVVLARKDPGNPLPRIIHWETLNVDTDFTLARQTIYDVEDLPFMRITPEAGELEKEYYKSARAWIDNRPGPIPMFPSGANDDEHLPGFLTITLALKKLENKIDKGLGRLNERIDKLEDNLSTLKREIDPKK